MRGLRLDVTLGFMLDVTRGFNRAVTRGLMLLVTRGLMPLVTIGFREVGIIITESPHDDNQPRNVLMSKTRRIYSLTAYFVSF